MRKKSLLLLIPTLALLIFSSCSIKQANKIEEPSATNLITASNASNLESKDPQQIQIPEKDAPIIEVKPASPITLTEKYKNQVPKLWGEKVDGIKTSLDTTEKVIALTFDACGGPQGNGYDEELINYLIEEQVPASLFINSRWIDANMDVFLSLSKNPLFEIENHGYTHSPLSVTGKSAYGIKGTKNVEEVLNEILINEEKIQKLTGRKPMFFRPGTAYADEVSVKIAEELGEEVVGYNVLGDAGATFNKNQIRESCLKATPGAIILLHMNHPEKQTYEGIKLVIPELKSRGFRFVKLSEYKLK